jgi:HEAT repeat protein
MAVRPLCETLLADSEVNVRYQAAVSLGELGHSEAAKCLNKALQDEEWVQFAVIEALKKIRDESSVSHLIEALGKGSDLVDSIIIDALGDIGNVKAVPLLLRSMDSAPVPLRNRIVQALVKMLGGQTLHLLGQEEMEKFRNYLLTAIEDDDSEVQDAAVQGLEYIGGEEASRAVFELVAGLNEELEPERIERIEASLRCIGRSKALEQALRSEDETVSARAIEVLTKMDDPRAGELLMEVFWDKDRDQQRAISKALSRSLDVEATDFFLQVLDRHKDGKVLKNALSFLGPKRRVREAAEKLLQFLDHPYNDVKEVALEACVALDSDVVRRRFLDMVGSQEPLYRLMAVYGLKQLQDRSALDSIRPLIHDPEPDVRKMALQALQALAGDLSSELFTIGTCVLDESKQVRQAAVNILGQSECTREAAPYLRQALEDEDDWVKVRALEALAKMPGHITTETVVSLLETPNKLLKIKAIETLEKIGGERAFKWLLQILQEEDADIRQSAEQALDRMKAHS